MAEWYEKPYKGGPMVAVRGFPRPLYPPDAAPGHQPSIDGPDVEAYKRTISRAGRWKWQAFDQAFSDQFSHGKGGNVINSGVAGVQRQQNMEPDTGWVGEKTFNALRSIKVPEHLPHAGEMAMDARAVELVNAAWEMFGGSEPAPTPPSGYPAGAAQARLIRATSQLGVKESPAHSNQVIYTDWYGMIGPWCAMFATWADLTGSFPCHNTFAKGTHYAYVPYIVSDARMGYRGLSITSSPKPGDLVCYDWDWDGEFDHVGIYEESLGGAQFYCIEGNTSPSNNSNGGEVMRRQRDLNGQDTVFVRVKE
jgi:hypothetical protein